MKSNSIFHRNPLLTLILLGLGLGLLLTALTWGSPAFADSLFNAAWPWMLLLPGAFLALVAMQLILAEPQGRAKPKPLYLLAVMVATALVYLFPELFAPGCGGMPRAFAACPPECRVTTCSDWDAPGENGCNAKPPDKGCCRSYDTTCISGCGDDDPGDPGGPGDPPPPSYQPPSVSGAVSCSGSGANGWCRNGAALNLSAADPQGFATTITGDIAGNPFSCGGPTCNQNLPAGSGTIHFQSSAPASGLSSAVGSASFAYDPTPPSITFNISGTHGTNGWYTSPVTFSIVALDAASGVATVEYRLDGGAWIFGNSLTLGDGEHTVEARATDQAGNQSVVTAAETIGIQVDTTPPTLVTTLSGTLGKNNWYVSNATVSASVSDVTSGVALTEYSLDHGTWIPGTRVVVSSDGAHTVQFRVMDRAGNKVAETRAFQIDQTKPSARFTVPGEASTGTIAQGAFLLEGQSIDAISGLASVQLSTDNGSTWLNLPTSPAGLWRYTWDTRPFQNGLYPILGRTEDLAGNVNDAAHVTLLLANHPPKVTIQESWSLGEAGKLSVQERFLLVTEISLRIACLDGQPDVKLNFTMKNLPEALLWDRKCGQGQFATSGNHLVTLKACDQVGNCASAEGMIKVPFVTPPTPTSTATVTPTATATPSPTRQPPKPTPTATRPVIAPTQEPPTEVPAEKPLPMPWLWPFAAFLGLLLAFGLSSLLDPRPAALRRLRETWQKVGNVRE